MNTDATNNELPGYSKMANLKRWLRKNIYAVGIGLLLFIAGAVSGSGITVVYFRSLFVMQANNPERLQNAFATKIIEAIPLTQEEQNVINEIIAKHAESIVARQQDFRGNIQQEFEDMREEISAVLGAERAQKYKGWLESNIRMQNHPSRGMGRMSRH